MGKKVEKPKEDLAPAYFVQYSSLWCIMLGFFVMLLTFGRTQMGPGSDGVGEVRDAFGKGGGLGLLPFAKNALFGNPNGGASTFRIRESAPKQIEKVDGYIRGMLWKRGLNSLKVLPSDDAAKVMLQIPVTFRGNEHLAQESIKMLEMLGEVLLDLSHYRFDVTVVGDAEKHEPQVCQRNAMLRAAVVARFLSDISSLTPERVRAVGYSDNRYLKAYGMELVNEYVLISIQKDDQ